MLQSDDPARRVQLARLLDRLAALRSSAIDVAADHDHHARFPAEQLAALRDEKLLVATLPQELGGLGVTPSELFNLFHDLGHLHLALGRIFEAHVNALDLIQRYGTAIQVQTAAANALAGALHALWVTDPPANRLSLGASGNNHCLHGEKWFCSGVGHAQWSLVTASTARGTQMLVVPAGPPVIVSHQSVRLAGMRAATTGSLDLTGLILGPEALIGDIGDYLREPTFSAAAWRNYAVILGGVSALIDVARNELLARGRSNDPYQRTRFGQATVAQETGRLWLMEAARRAETVTGSGDDVVAYVNLARIAAESACLDAIGLVQRSLGISAFRVGSPAERICRDLATYLRQPAPDEALDKAAAYCFANQANWTSHG